MGKWNLFLTNLRKQLPDFRISLSPHYWVTSLLFTIKNGRQVRLQNTDGPENVNFVFIQQN